MPINKKILALSLFQTQWKEQTSCDAIIVRVPLNEALRSVRLLN